MRRTVICLARCTRAGDRLAFSNGIVFLALAAIIFVVAFGGEVTALIQLYIVGVLVSFTLSQTGMVRHWTRLLSVESDPARRRMQRSRVINAIGLVMTATVLVVVLITKFLAGAWIAIVAMMSLYVLMHSPVSAASRCPPVLSSKGCPAASRGIDGASVHGRARRRSVRAGFRTIHSNAIVAHRCAALTALSDALGTPTRPDLRAGSEVIAVHDDDDAVHLPRSPDRHPCAAAGPAHSGDGRRAVRRARRESWAARRHAIGSAIEPRELPVAAFWQAHGGRRRCSRALRARWLASRGARRTVWDLYGGSGVFAGAAIERGAGAVHIVDTEADALASARTTFHRFAGAHASRGGYVPAGTLADAPRPASSSSTHPQRGRQRGDGRHHRGGTRRASSTSAA